MKEKAWTGALVGAAAVLALVAGAAALVLGEDDALPPPVMLMDPASGVGVADDKVPLTREEFSRAIQAALGLTGGGKVVEVDRSDDPGEAYELEVVRDGREVDVALDERFRVVPNRRYDD